MIFDADFNTILLSAHELTYFPVCYGEVQHQDDAEIQLTDSGLASLSL